MVTSSDTRRSQGLVPPNTPILGNLRKPSLVDVVKAPLNRSLRNGAEPLGGNAVEISPPADVLGRKPHVLGERNDALGQTARTPPLDDIDTFHVVRTDTIRVARQHDQHRDFRQSVAMNPGFRLRNFRKAAHLTVEQMTERTGFAASTIRAHENGQNGLTAKAASVYAKVLGLQAAQILFESDIAAAAEAPQPSVRRAVDEIPIVGSVRAGAWTEMRDGPDEVTEWIYFNDPEYRRATKFALVVEGPSMNVHYPDGSKVICVPAAEAGVREGDHVVVRRRRGSLVETTLKEVVIDADGGVLLWPRSFDEAFQTPMRISTADDSDEGSEIVAVVIGKYENRRAGKGPLLTL